jgi:hypothetical protein
MDRFESFFARVVDIAGSYLARDVDKAGSCVSVTGLDATTLTY